MQSDAPIFTRLLGAGSDISDRTVTLALGVDAERGLRVDMDLGIVGPVIAALAAEAAKLNDQIPEGKENFSATLHASHVWLSQDDEGFPMIVFELPGKTPLPFSLRGADLPALAAELGLLAAKPAGRAN